MINEKITTDLLVKGGWIDTGYYFIYGISSVFYIWFDKNTSELGISISDIDTPLPHITHIHHLQNLIMALTGKEWDIKP